MEVMERRVAKEIERISCDGSGEIGCGGSDG